MTKAKGRDWNDGEQDLLRELFSAVWKEVEDEVGYQIELTDIRAREAVFTVEEKGRVFARPQRYEEQYPMIGDTRTREVEGFGIYVEKKVPSSRSGPAHLDEYLYTATRTPGGVAREIVTLPIRLRAGAVVERMNAAKARDFAQETEPSS